MSASVTSDKNFWLAYCTAIKQASGTNIGAKSAMFFASKAQKGPLASPLIDASYTNNGIFNLGDNLLQADNLFYVPSAQNSYSRSLLTYLNWVDLGGDQEEGVVVRVILAKKAYDAALTASDTEQDKAYTAYEKARSRGLTGTQTFGQWYFTHAPGYSAALNQVQAAAATWLSAINQMSGPYAASYSTDVNTINQALTSTEEAPGISMPCCDASPATAQEMLNNINSGKDTPAPKGIFYRPNYQAAEYQSTVKNWINLSVSGTPNSTQIKASDGSSTDATAFGQTSVGGGLSVSYGPWFSFGANASSDKSDTSDSAHLTENDVEIKMTYDDIKAVPITPGAWNIGDPKNRYGRLKPGAPDSVKVLVAPTQLIIVRNLGYKITINSSVKGTFDQKIKETQSGGGSLRIFGIPIGVGASASKSTETTTHTSTWDGSSGVLEVKPTPDGAFATVVAILGDKITTT